MLFATNCGAAQEKNFTRQGFSVAAVHHRRGRKSPLNNNSETKPQGPLLENRFYNGMRGIRAAPKASPTKDYRTQEIGRARLRRAAGRYQESASPGRDFRASPH